MIFYMSHIKKYFLISIVCLCFSLVPIVNAEYVPDWVKNTAGWWATDAISETEFVNAIEFLVNEEIVTRNSTDWPISISSNVYSEKFFSMFTIKNFSRIKIVINSCDKIGKNQVFYPKYSK